jgi:uncharacterized membrane protein
VSTTWIVIVASAAGIYALKAAGPLLIGRRELPTRWTEPMVLLPAALLAALVVVSAFAEGRRLVLDARVVGLLAAGVALWRRAGFVTVVVLAAVTTALVRALG